VIASEWPLADAQAFATGIGEVAKGVLRGATTCDDPLSPPLEWREGPDDALFVLRCLTKNCGIAPATALAKGLDIYVAHLGERGTAAAGYPSGSSPLACSSGTPRPRCAGTSDLNLPHNELGEQRTRQTL